MIRALKNLKQDDGLGSDQRCQAGRVSLRAEWGRNQPDAKPGLSALRQQEEGALGVKGAEDPAGNRKGEGGEG